MVNLSFVARQSKAKKQALNGTALLPSRFVRLYFIEFNFPFSAVRVTFSNVFQFCF